MGIAVLGVQGVGNKDHEECVEQPVKKERPYPGGSRSFITLHIKKAIKKRGLEDAVVLGRGKTLGRCLQSRIYQGFVALGNVR